VRLAREPIEGGGDKLAHRACGGGHGTSPFVSGGLPAIDACALGGGSLWRGCMVLEGLWASAWLAPGPTLFGFMKGPTPMLSRRRGGDAVRFLVGLVCHHTSKLGDNGKHPLIVVRQYALFSIAPLHEEFPGRERVRRDDSNGGEVSAEVKMLAELSRCKRDKNRFAVSVCHSDFN
jgi:hypothetical protein